jgi:acetylornithine deacetylase/succinyl-diaminopimelate desuccinylase-like protein
MSLEQLLALADRSLPEAAALLQELIRIPTVNAGPGSNANETALCNALATKLRSEGIEATILEAAPGRGSLVATLEGGDGPRLLYLSHGDVVPVEEPLSWKFPPFGGIEADGAIHGRGAADCKGLVAAEAMALILLKRSAIPIAGQLRLVVAADEEAGGAMGCGWLLRTHPGLLEADYAVNEGGGTCFALPGKLCYLLSTGEKGRLEATVRLRGEGGHAALPWAATNPCLALGRLLERLRHFQPLPQLEHPIFEAVRELLPQSATRLLQADYFRVDKPLRALISALRAAAFLTITPTMLQAGLKSNVIPSLALLRCDVRTLPGQTQKDVAALLQRLLQEAGLEGAELSLEPTAEPSASSYPTSFSLALQRALALAIEREDAIVLPALTPGFTDSRFLRPLGAIAYGFAPQGPDPEADAPHGVHAGDERLSLGSLRTLLRALVALAWLVLVERRCG